MEKPSLPKSSPTTMQIIKQWYLINGIDSLAVANGHISKPSFPFFPLSLLSSSENIFHSSLLPFSLIKSTLG